MLNKPKFMSPSVNMYGNTVIDLNSETLPFSCIVDGNEVVTHFQIVVSRLKDNLVVFDTGMQKLENPFFPINNRNQNVILSIDLKEYFTKVSTDDGDVYIPYLLNTVKEYNSNRTYYSYSSGKYVKYTYSDDYSWGQCYNTLYTCDFINSPDAFYWNITLKNENSNTITYSASEVFYANSIPEANIYCSYDNNFFVYDIKTDEYFLNEDLLVSTDKDNPSVFNKRKIFFKAIYNQDENILIKRYGWRITDITNNQIVLDTISHNQIYGIADDISCTCNGLMNQTNYLVEVYIETQNGYSEVLQSAYFNIDYAVKNIDADFEVMALNNTAGIMLNWGNLRTTEGVVVGNSVSYVDNFPVQASASIEIPHDTSVVFEGTSSDKDLGIDENSYVVVSFQFDKTQSTILFEMTGLDEYSNYISRKLEYMALNRVLRYSIIKDGRVSICEKTLNDTASELCWHVATLYPLINGIAEYKLIQSTAMDGLFPDDDLYPEDLYVYDEDGNTIDGEYNKATENYDPILTYFKIVNDEFVEYVYDEETWGTDWEKLYCCLHANFGKWDALRNEVV